MAPSLPPELEREIFETTALVFPTSICNLLRVSRRALEWIQPLLFRTLFLQPGSEHTTAFLRVLQNTPPGSVAAFVHNSVHNVYVPRTLYLPSETRLILAACTGLTNLAMLSADPAVLPLLAPKRLRRLALSLAQLFDNGALLPNLRHPLFLHTTHLSLLDQTHNEADAHWAAFALLPALTHLCLQSFVHRRQLVAVLRACPRLEVLVNMHIDSEPEWGLADINARLCIFDDPRFVLCTFNRSPNAYARDFRAGLEGSGDLWAHAGAFVAKKRRGEIKPASRCWICDHDGIY